MKLFAIIAGESNHTFSIGGIDFKAAPLTLREQSGYYDAAKAGDAALCEYIAERLKLRIVGTKVVDREMVTGEWLMENVSGAAFPVIIDLLINGEHEKKALQERVASSQKSS